ncbi:hypothetical protein Tco_1481907, partial [Tanacetum coccineum]
AINNEAKDVDKYVEVIDNDSFDSYESDEGVKLLVKKHSLETRRELKLVKNDKERVRAICFGTIPVFSDGPNDAGPSNIGCSSIVPINIGCSSIEPINTGAKPSSKKQKKEGTGRVFKDKPQGNQCPWILHVSKLKEDETWVVKTFNDVHKCLQQRNVKAATAGFLSQQIIDQVEVNPEIPVKAIQDQLQKKYRLDVSKMKAFRAKSKAYAHVRGDYREQYKVLRNYCLELSHKNPGTTVRIEVEPEEDPNVETRVFKRIYICLGPLKDGFRAGMRDLLGLDGAFMKGPFPGQVLAAVGLDSNNGIYPVAYAIVEAENKDSWTWFLECLGEDLNLGPMSNFTFITDRQKVLPKTHTRKYEEALERRSIQRLIMESCESNNSPTLPEGNGKHGGLKYEVSGPWNDKCVVDISARVCSCRKFEVTGIPCKHLVATIWNNAANRQNVGLPENWVHLTYILETWKQMYSFTLSPIDGITMWPNSDVPTTLLPPFHHTQIGRPRKNRRRGAHEDDDIVKGAKLSRSWK